MAKTKTKAPPDVVLLHSPTEDGEGIRAIRSRAETLELAELRPLKEGKPLSGSEVVRLRPRKEHPLLCDVEVQYSTRADERHAGPARVASDQYRENWKQIFGAAEAAESNEGHPQTGDGEDELPRRRDKLVN